MNNVTTSSIQFEEVESKELNSINVGHFIAGYGAGIAAAGAAAAVAGVILT
ncbi:hypothetical protein [Lactococcus lactis]|uniref:hypothetical protein n=1 Tax=Lactococcus lactis TaxID=1358 RepID=UPI00345D1408